MNETALQVLPKETMSVAAPMTANDILSQVALIQEVMSRVMKENEHFGKIPGCGDKPALLKPGAEKLGMTFRLAPQFDETITDLGNGHREYRIKCTLTTIGQNTFVGQGVGSCSTMESKYRYRTENTRKPVPKEYWDTRDQSLLGGPAYSPRKVDKEWLIFHKVEHDNPADYYNTVHKMAKKRAHVDAILTATAASDIFVQDVEEMVADGLIEPKQQKQQDKPKKYTRVTGMSDEEQQQARVVAEIEGKLAGIGLRPQDLVDFGKHVKWDAGETLAQFPLPRLHWIAQNFRGLVDELKLFKNDDQLPGAEAACGAQAEMSMTDLRRAADEGPPDVEREAEQRMEQALRKTQEGEVSQGIIEHVAVKTGKSHKGPWTRYGIKIDGAYYNSFDSKLGALAEELKGQPVTFVFRTGEKGFNDLVSIQAE